MGIETLHQDNHVNATEEKELRCQVFRCVCFYCSKLLLDKDNKRVKDIIRKTQGNPRRRFTLIYDMCKSKVVCDGGNEIENVNPEEGEDGEEVIKGSGCGPYQPLCRRTGIDLNAVWKKNVNEDTQVFGGQGDFITAPELSELFGELLGVWCYYGLANTGHIGPWQLVECGPGTGQLMHDILVTMDKFQENAYIWWRHLSPHSAARRAALWLVLVSSELIQWGFIPEDIRADKERLHWECCPEDGTFVNQITERIVYNGGFELIIDYGHNGLTALR